MAKIHQITKVIGEGSTDDSVTISPSPASHSGITTTASVRDIFFGISAGVARAGYSVTFNNAQAGYSENTRSFSVRQEIANGKMYVRNRNKSKSPSGSIQMVEAEYNKFIDFVEVQDAKPFACLLFDNLGLTSRNAGFFIFSEFPNGTFNSSRMRTINFNFREFI